MSASLHHLVYQSVATSPLEEPDLARILSHSRAWNTEHGLTGVLLYSNGNLLQVLEGPEDEVRHIFSRIARDARHANVTKLADGPIARRQFEQWSMGFKVVNPDDFAQLQGYVTPGSAAARPADEAGLHAVLAAFAAQDIVRL